MGDNDEELLEQLEIDGGRVEDIYELGPELGKGAFSVVKQGKHRTTGQKAAIKMILNGRFKGNTRAQAAILSEIEAMRRIRERSKNPCLISMLGVYKDPSKVCIALEQLEGGELFDRIVARGQYTEKDASRVLRKLALALKDCHSNGIVHRDVKPENILYVSEDDDSEIKLTDFGLAMLESGASVSRIDDNLVGTPGYVAPEVLQSREYGPPCDVWACGVITYILLVGYPPFFAAGDDSLFEVIKKMKSTLYPSELEERMRTCRLSREGPEKKVLGQYYFHPDAWEMISGEAKDLIYQMLMVDTARRASVEAIINHPWVTQQHGLPEQHLSGTIQRLKAFNAKRKWRAVAAVVMVGARLGLKKRSRSDSDEDRYTRLSQLELQTLKRAFDASSEGGVLSRAQLAAVMSDIGFGPVPLDRLFDLFDADGNGEVDYEEFLAGISRFRSSGDKALQFCFNIYDRDGVGAIKMDQLKTVLSCVLGTQDDRSVMPRPSQTSASSHSSASSAALGRPAPEGAPARSNEGEGAGNSSKLQDDSIDEPADRERKLSELFAALDVDGNGTIDFDEFKSGVKREPLLVQAFLAPVQQGSLGKAPVTRRKSSPDASLAKNGADANRENVNGVESGNGGEVHCVDGCRDQSEKEDGTGDDRRSTDRGITATKT